MVHNTLGLTGAGVRVAVLDTGIDTDHPDLSDNIVVQHCFTNAQCAPNNTDEGTIAEDIAGHGTAVSGIITSKGTVAPIGFAPDADIIAIRMLALDARVEDLAATLDWIIANQDTLEIDIITMSFGVPFVFYSSNDSCDAAWPEFASAMGQLNNLGITIFAAAGNEGGSTGVISPGCLTNVISVGATYDSDLGREPDSGTYQSNYGSSFPDTFDANTNLHTVTAFTNSGPTLDVLAPGARIASTGLGGGASSASFGTSFSSPTAAGVAALMLQADPDLSPAQIESVLKSTGTLVTDSKNGLSFPLINALAAVNAVYQPPPNGNLVVNGDFSAGVDSWTFYGPLDAWAPDGTIQFKRLDNSAPGGFWQATSETDVPAGTPFAVSVDLGNNGGFNKDVLIRLSDSTRGTALDCSFTVTQASPLQTFTMSGLSPTLFDNLTVTVEETTADGYPDVLMDNLNVAYAPGQGISTTTCTSPTLQAAPADTNLIRNGDFSDGNKQWVIWGIVDGWSPTPELYFKARYEAGYGGVYQNLFHTVPAGAPMEVSLQLGNTSSVVKTVQVVLGNGINWDDARICNFAVFPNTPLQTFTLTGESTTPWTDIRLETNPGPPDDIPDIVMDNVQVFYHPSASYPVTTCTAPASADAPGNQDLVRNGDFNGGEGNWTHWGDIDVWAPNSTLYTKRRAGGGDGSMFQDLFYGLAPDTPVELTVDLANTGGVDKVAQFFLHDDNWTEAVTCDFNLPAGQSTFQQFRMRGLTTQQWANVRLEIKPQPNDGIPDVHVDNIVVQARPDLAGTVTGTTCENVSSPAPVSAQIEPSVTPTLEPETTEAVLPPTETSLPTETPLPTATTEPLQAAVPPLLDTLDTGAVNWQVDGLWTLSEAGRMGDSGMGWIVDASADGISTLIWMQPIDLSAAQTPRLVFYSKLASTVSQAVVQAQTAGGEWQTVAIVNASDDWAETLVNLSAYSGQVINLRFAWIATASADRWAIDLVGVDNAWTEPTPVIEPSATPLPTETLAPETTEAVNPEVTQDVTPVVTATEEASNPEMTQEVQVEPSATPLPTETLAPEMTEAVLPPTATATETATDAPAANDSQAEAATKTPTAAPTDLPAPTETEPTEGTLPPTLEPLVTATTVPTVTPVATITLPPQIAAFT